MININILIDKNEDFWFIANEIVKELGCINFKQALKGVYFKNKCLLKEIINDNRIINPIFIRMQPSTLMINLNGVESLVYNNKESNKEFMSYIIKLINDTK